jgi:hypothetical protein
MFISLVPPTDLPEHTMALIFIAALVLVPLALLLWDLPRKASTYSDADVEPNAPRALGSAIRVHA